MLIAQKEGIQLANVSLGQRIRELRLKLGITQGELGSGLISASMVSQIESDRAKPSYRVLYALADRLEVPFETLLVDVDMNLESISTYKMAKAMVAAMEYITAIPLLKEVLAKKRAVISEDEPLIELSECYLHTGQFEDAEKLLSRVQESAVLRQDSHI